MSAIGMVNDIREALLERDCALSVIEGPDENSLIVTVLSGNGYKVTVEHVIDAQVMSLRQSLLEANNFVQFERALKRFSNRLHDRLLASMDANGIEAIEDRRSEIRAAVEFRLDLTAAKRLVSLGGTTEEYATSRLRRLVIARLS